MLLCFHTYKIIRAALIITDCACPFVTWYYVVDFICLCMCTILLFVIIHTNFTIFTICTGCVSNFALYCIAVLIYYVVACTCVLTVLTVQKSSLLKEVVVAIANSCVALYVCVYPGKVSYPSPPPARSSPTLRCPTTTVRKYVKTEGTQVSRHAIWLYRKSRVCEYD